MKFGRGRIKCKASSRMLSHMIHQPIRFSVFDTSQIGRLHRFRQLRRGFVFCDSLTDFGSSSIRNGPFRMKIDGSEGRKRMYVGTLIFQHFTCRLTSWPLLLKHRFVRQEV